ncbi:hypothetical protein CW749_26895 [Vibrio sp. vnigr-6D03]|uniref:hypothetical protein n=1 Tax=Vibrio sp. vnigr-6D03 TaxID=2058088 RepID=UPI000C325F6A|nr:hypothetical protein [Vibrio sp. vnigr-6D03]PKF76462.1 hypothetical protein CW749_26895 [Vibrio sp. vnigr-6D03]
MKNKLFIVGVIFTVLFAAGANAKRYWPTQKLTNWELYLNNGVAYVASPQFAAHCSYDRGQINMSGTEYDKALYSYALSAKARGKKLSYVVDNTHSNCVISALREHE